MMDYTNIIKEQGVMETIYKERKAAAKLKKGRDARARQLECIRLKNEKENLQPKTAI